MMASPNERESIQKSLDQFRALRQSLGPEASAEQQRYLDEMIAMGERALNAAPPRPWPTRKHPSAFSLSWRRVGAQLLLFFAILVVMLVAYAFLGWA